MDLICQKECIQQLKKCAIGNKQSVLIEGQSGYGKTYLAKLYSVFLNIDDFQIVSPTVQDIKTSLEICSQLGTPVVVCIENLDMGVAGASYMLLKFLEEPRSTVYVVVTCRNLQRIPDTIISRSVCISTCPPVSKDVELYSLNKNAEKYRKYRDTIIWKCCRSLSDINNVLQLSEEQIKYFLDLSSMSQFKEPVLTMAWNLSHYPDGKESLVELSIKILLEQNRTNRHIQNSGLQCLQDISSNRVSVHAALCKFLLECKYCE